MDELRAQMDRMEHELRRVESKVDHLGESLGNGLAEVRDAVTDIRLRLERQAGVESTQEALREQLPTFPARLDDHERRLKAVEKAAPRKAAIVQLVESEHGRTVIYRTLAAVVAVALALAGGLTATDLRGWLTGAPEVVIAADDDGAGLLLDTSPIEIPSPELEPAPEPL